MSKVPVSQCLSCCARVSSKPYSAAVAVTTTVALSNPSRNALSDSFPVYLSKHGQHLSSIRIASKEQTVGVPALPCPNLKKLDLEWCSFRLSEASADILQDCTGLTYLRLQRCRVAGQQPGIAALATRQSCSTWRWMCTPTAANTQATFLTGCASPGRCCAAWQSSHT